MDKTASLTPEVKAIVCDKSTELPNSGQYNLLEGKGTYLCRRCGIALFRGSHKFISQCGWPSFDDEITGRIQRQPDPDGRRTEILCRNCGAHLGHVFHGENYTAKNLRHCVNSLALDFVASQTVHQTEEIILAAGCFWGVEYCLTQEPGVIFTEVGYTGGTSAHPTYNQVCSHTTHHQEALRVIFDCDQTNLERILKCFFEIHDSSQIDGQGPDLGEQYGSSIFYYDEPQKEVAKKLILQLKKLGNNPSTKILPATVFWPAESHHQHYYEKNGKLPYCHLRRHLAW